MLLNNRLNQWQFPAVRRILLFLLIFFNCIYSTIILSGKESDDDTSINLSQFSAYSDKTREKADEAFLLIEEGEGEKALEPLEYAAAKRVRPSMASYAFYLISEENLKQTKTPIVDIKKAARYFLMSAYRGWGEARDLLDEQEKLYKQLTSTPQTEQELVQVERSNGRHVWQLFEEITKLQQQQVIHWLEGKEPCDSIKEIEDLTFLVLLTHIPNEVLQRYEKTCVTRFLNKFYQRKKLPIKLYTAADIDRFAREILKLPTSVPAKYGNCSDGDKYLNTKHKLLYAYMMLLKRLNHVSEKKFLKKNEGTREPSRSKTSTKQKSETYKAINATSSARAAGPVFDGLKDNSYSQSSQYSSSVPSTSVNSQSQKSATSTRRDTQPLVLTDDHKYLLEPLYKILGELFVVRGSQRPNWLVELTHLDPPFQAVLQFMGKNKKFKEHLSKYYSEKGRQSGRKEGQVYWPNPSLYERDGVKRERKKIKEINVKYNDAIETMVDSDSVLKSILYRLSLIQLYQFHYPPDETATDSSQKITKKHKQPSNSSGRKKVKQQQ